jgi:hypothetical protein
VRCETGPRSRNVGETRIDYEDMLEVKMPKYTRNWQRRASRAVVSDIDYYKRFVNQIFSCKTQHSQSLSWRKDEKANKSTGYPLVVSPGHIYDMSYIGIYPRFILVR